MRLRPAVYILPALMALASPAVAAPINVAFGATVTATGAIGNTTFGAWPDPAPAALSTIVDDLFLAEGAFWQEAVWWNENPSAAGAPSPALNNIIEIDLGGIFQISHVAIQGDNNDQYFLSYRDRFGSWTPFAYADVAPGAGMRTRSGNVAFEATAFRIDASGGDGYYSVSEFQAEGVAAPEPASMLLLGTGGIAMLVRRRRKS